MIELNGVSKSYRNQKIFHECNFALNQGDIALISGASGSGKSLFLKMILGMDSYDSGVINLYGSNLKKTKNKNIIDIRSRIGAVFQNSSLVDCINIFENIALKLYFNKHSSAEIKYRISSILDLFSLSSKQKFYPKLLSSSDYYLVLIARALISNPSLLVLDEPHLKLNESALNILMQVINAVNKSSISVLITCSDFDLYKSLGCKKYLLRNNSISRVDKVVL